MSDDRSQPESWAGTAFGAVFVVLLPGTVFPGRHRDASMRARADTRLPHGLFVEGVDGSLPRAASPHAQPLE